MPRQPQWYQRIPDALQALDRIAAPVVDRQGLEQLLGLGRRDAIRLMHRLGGYQCGRTFLIDRDILRDRLRSVAAGDTWRWEMRRRLRLAEDIDAARSSWKAQTVAVPVPPLRSEGLPASVRLVPGRLEIDFQGSVDLLTKLVQLTRELSRDLERFQEELGD